jgi:hypothetical protein
MDPMAVYIPELEAKALEKKSKGASFSGHTH